VNAGTSEAPSRWIVSRRFDLAWFFGGAAVALVAVALALASWVPLVPLVWGLFLLVDGSHMAAAYTRTYADRAFLRERPGVALGTLAAFAAGPAALALGVALGSEAPWSLFLAAATFYAVYHMVRQHYGFLALYKAVNGDRGDIAFDKWCLYLGSWLPYAHFLLTHPRIRALLERPPSPSPLERALSAALVALWVITVIAFFARAASRSAATRVLPKALYMLATFSVYALTYWVIARFEPFYKGAVGPDQEFLLIAIMAGVFHGAQYVGLIWFHNRRRYGSASAGGAGAAAWISRSLPRYLLVCLAFVPLYWLVACGTGVYPGCQAFVGRRLGPVSLNQLALCLWWGIALHHYVLDQSIWRVRSDAALREALVERPLQPAPRTCT
jgi:hypothetical protein